MQLGVKPTSEMDTHARIAIDYTSDAEVFYDILDDNREEEPMPEISRTPPPKAGMQLGVKPTSEMDNHACIAIDYTSDDEFFYDILDDDREEEPMPEISWTPPPIDEVVFKLSKDLEDLNHGGPIPEPSRTPLQGSDYAVPESPQHARDKKPHEGPSGSGPLAHYHRGVAVRMMTDYISDLVALNVQEFLNKTDESRQQHQSIVQKRIEEYRTALTAVEEANRREPDGQLLWQERDILKRMLKDYARGLQEVYVYEQSESVDEGELKDQLVELNAKIDRVESGIAVDYSVECFPLLMNSLGAALHECKEQVSKFTLLQFQLKVFVLQCTNLIETLSQRTNERCPWYKDIYKLLEEYDIGRQDFSTRQHIFKAVAFCIEALQEAARIFQGVSDLLSRCCKEEWWRTALKLGNVPTQSNLMRLSPFYILHSKSEWSMDILELAFHALKKSFDFDGTTTFDDIDFKWSDENWRMELQIRDKQRRSTVGLLKVYKDLEAKDKDILVQKLKELAEQPRAKFLASEGTKQMYGMANHLLTQLTGPTPKVSELPYSFRIDSSSLKGMIFKEYLDSGASGMVAKFRWLGEIVAVKMVRSPGLKRAKFEQEASILAAVQHPNVVRIIGCAYLDKTETGMLVMELMEHDLRTVIDKQYKHRSPGSNPFPLTVSIDIMYQIAESMRYLHDHNVLHRDLKAKNVLVNRCITIPRHLHVEIRTCPGIAAVLHTQDYYVAKLADFGLAKCRLQSPWVATRMAGTTLWRAPEVFNVVDTEVATEYEKPADVYSFGMTCYEILTGKVPFDDGRPMSSIYKSIVRGERPSFDDVQVPSRLKALIQECWATNPHERPKFVDICKKLWHCKIETVLPVFRLHHVES